MANGGRLSLAGPPGRVELLLQVLAVTLPVIPLLDQLRERLADCTNVRVKASRADIVAAVHGRVTAHHRFLLELHLGQIDALRAAVQKLEQQADEVLRPFREAAERLTTMAGEAAARAADAARGRQPGQDRNPKGGPPYKRAYGEPDEKAQSNFTDPESSIMKTSNEGFQQCYNAQVTADAEHQLVVATDLTANASDQGELPVLLDAVKETFDAQPETVLADAGYCNERDLTDLEKRGVDGYVAPGREGKQTATRDLKAHPATGRMVEKLATPAGRTAYAERKWLSEAPNGWIKHRAGVSALQPAWAGEGAVRVGPGVPGVERQAPAAADGGVEGGR